MEDDFQPYYKVGGKRAEVSTLESLDLLGDDTFNLHPHKTVSQTRRVLPNSSCSPGHTMGPLTSRTSQSERKGHREGS